jgi:hypothetical protein
MIEALRTLANITDYSDAELASLVETFGRVCSLHQLTVPVTSVIDARRELERVKDPGDSAVSAANIVACAEALVAVGGVGPEFMALDRALDNMRGHRRV